MSDYLAAQVTLGGCLSRALVPRLCKLLGHASLALDWDQPALAPRSVEDLLAARRTIDGEWLLQLVVDDAPYGAFAELEAFLVKHKIPFDRQSDAGHGYDGQLATYRPQTGITAWLATGQGQPAVPALPLWEISEGLERLFKMMGKAPRHVVQHRLEQLLVEVREAVPPRPFPLPTFEIGKTVGLRKAA